MARKSEKPNLCKCGKLIRNTNVEKCSTCSYHYMLIKKTVYGGFLSEEEIEALVLERTKKFRNSLSNLGNDK